MVELQSRALYLVVLRAVHVGHWTQGSPFYKRLPDVLLCESEATTGVLTHYTDHVSLSTFFRKTSPWILFSCSTPRCFCLPVYRSKSSSLIGSSPAKWEGQVNRVPRRCTEQQPDAHNSVPAVRSFLRGEITSDKRSFMQERAVTSEQTC